MTCRSWAITAEVLQEAGYKYFPPSPSMGAPYCKGLYQKVKWNAALGKRLYFVNFYLYRFTPPAFPTESDSVSASTHLYTDSGDVKMEYLVQADTTLEQVEAFFWKAYQRMDGVPDKHNN